MNFNERIRLAEEKFQAGKKARDSVKYQQAADNFLAAAELWKGIKGQEVAYAACLGNAANALKELGYYDNAKLLLEKARDIQKKYLGAEHPDVASSLNNLAGIYQVQGNTEKAAEYYQRAQSIINKVFQNENHPTAKLISRNYLKLQQEVETLKRCDIEQRIALEETKKLEYLSYMATGIAHNINNPVGIIRLAAQRGLRELEKGLSVEKGQEIFQRILGQADRLHTIIKSFRNYAKGDRQR